MVRIWTDDEIRAVICLHDNGLLLKDIAAAVDRPLGSIKGLAAKLARRGDLPFRQPAFGFTAGFGRR